MITIDTINLTTSVQNITCLITKWMSYKLYCSSKCLLLGVSMSLGNTALIEARKQLTYTDFRF